MKTRLLRILDRLGLEILIPFVRLATGENPRQQLRQIGLVVLLPVLTFVAFLGVWSGVARNVETKFGTLPRPGDVFTAGRELLSAHAETRRQEREYYAEQKQRAASFEQAASQLLASAPTSATTATTRQIELLRKRAENARSARFSASPTYIDQILTSLKTVFAGFLLASIIAIPIGILCGSSRAVRAALDPLVQIFKPVSPLAWLPIVMILVAALYTTDPEEAWFEKSFISSACTVALCSLWPTLVNTALGVTSVQKDHLDVARSLGLDTWTKIRKIVIPSALPLIFTGLRISLGVGWMVLIAAEMLAQNPGLGKFVWDMFQNGSSDTLARIMVAVFTIGIVGFLLDRAMVVLQRAVSYETAK